MLEQDRLNEIRTKVNEAGLEFRASREEASAKEYFRILDEAVKEAETWREDVNNKVEQVQGYGNSTFPKQDDPYFRLLSRSVPFLIELERERNNLAVQLEQIPS